jgi:hypothetical protein
MDGRVLIGTAPRQRSSLVRTLVVPAAAAVVGGLVVLALEPVMGRFSCFGTSQPSQTGAPLNHASPEAGGPVQPSPPTVSPAPSSPLANGVPHNDAPPQLDPNRAPAAPTPPLTNAPPRGTATPQPGIAPAASPPPGKAQCS